MTLKSSWGRLSASEHRVVSLSDRSQLSRCLATHKPGIAYGMGRSYGDACLNPNGVLWAMGGLDRFISFDEQTGVLVCEAGVLLRDIQQYFMPRGWMLPVTPGTQWVTVGGAIANDVHGKNHHVCGTFGDHVRRLHLLRTDGQLLACSPDHNADWLAATIGGIGLTGLITTIELQLQATKGPWLDAETIAYTGLSDFFDVADSSEADWQYTVSWIDCLSKKGRGLFMRANPAIDQWRDVPQARVRRMPITPPISLVNRCTLAPFNWAYFHWTRRHRQSHVHYQPFFYPLDGLSQWNRMYGPRGFYQYQCVVPRGSDAIGAILAAIARSGEGSFLAVLKTFGNRAPRGLLSFAQAGVSLALDFPNRGVKTLQLLARLDAIVAEANGRLYLAKDARMPRSLFEAGYPRFSEFLRYRDPGIDSAMARRLLGE